MVQIGRHSQRRRTRGNSYLRLRFFCTGILLSTLLFLYFFGNGFEDISTYRSPSIQRARDRNCSRFGCAIYPRELTESVRLDIAEILDKKDEDVALSYGDKGKGGLTQQGKDHGVNQDRGIIVSPFYVGDEKTNIASDHDFLIGIFDGHGTLGHEVAQFIQDNFHKKLSEKLSNTEINHNLSADVVKRALNQTFIELDRELPLIEGNKDNYNIGEDGGSTASIILRLGSKIFFANVGDSLSFLGKYDKKSGETTILHRNRFDKPHLPDEKERIERLHGKIFIPPHPENSRVMGFDLIAKETMSLGMSRSIGDNSHTRVGVTAEPIIDVLDLDEMGLNLDTNLFVVSSSDGLYDHRKPEFVASHFAQSFFANNGHPIVESQNIIDLATPKNPLRYRDDITVMALKITV